MIGLLCFALVGSKLFTSLQSQANNLGGAVGIRSDSSCLEPDFFTFQAEKHRSYTPLWPTGPCFGKETTSKKS